MEEKQKKRLEQAAQSGSTKTIVDPPSPIRRQVKWKMARTKKSREMIFEAAREIEDRIVSYFLFISMVNFYNNIIKSM